MNIFQKNLTKAAAMVSMTLLFTGGTLIAHAGADSPSGVSLNDMHEFIIGASVAKTGGQTLYGGPAMVAAKNAIKDINAKGGIDGKKIKLIWRDSQTNYAKSAAAAAKVIKKGAHVLLVDCDFNYGLPAAQVAQKHGIVAMFLCAGSPRSGNPQILPLGFSMGIATNVEASAIADFAYKNLGYRSIYQLKDTSLGYSNSLCHYFAERWKALGGKIVGESTFTNSDSSLQGQITEMRRNRDSYDAIDVCSYNPGLSTAIRQIRSGGIEATLLGSFTWDGNSWLGQSGAGSLSNAYYPAYASIYGDDPRPQMNELVKYIRQHLGDVPFTSFATPGYGAVQSLVKAAKIAGTTNGHKMAKVLESFHNEKLLIGPATYSKKEHIRMLGKNHIAIMKINNGKQKFERMVTPRKIPSP